MLQKIKTEAVFCLFDSQTINLVDVVWIYDGVLTESIYLAAVSVHNFGFCARLKEN